MIVRPTTSEDIPQIQSIYEYYALNTVITFLTNKPPPDCISNRFESARTRHLPFLSAVDQVDSHTETVIGYAYASAFRGGLLAYGPTVEMSIFCHPDHINKGVGSKLMAELLKALQNTKHRCYETGHEDNVQEFQVKNILSVMAVDEDASGHGLALRDWYIKWGFEQVGRLKGVGSKFGKW